MDLIRITVEYLTPKTCVLRYNWCLFDHNLHRVIPLNFSSQLLILRFCGIHVKSLNHYVTIA